MAKRSQLHQFFASDIGTVEGVAWLDANTVAAATHGGRLVAFDTRAGQRVGEQAAQTKSFAALVANPDGTELLAGQKSYRAASVAVLRFAWPGLTPVGTFAEAPGSVEEIVVSPDGRRIGLGISGKKCAVHVLDAANGRLMVPLPVNNSESPPSVAFAADGRLLVGLLNGMLTRYFDSGVQDGNTELPGLVTAIRPLPGGRLLVAREHDNSFELDANLQPTRRLPGHGAGAWDAAVSPDGKLAATACRDGVLRLWDMSPR